MFPIPVKIGEPAQQSGRSEQTHSCESCVQTHASRRPITCAAPTARLDDTLGYQHLEIADLPGFPYGALSLDGGVTSDLGLGPCPGSMMPINGRRGMNIVRA